jgi:hypothetical protein
MTGEEMSTGLAGSLLAGARLTGTDADENSGDFGKIVGFEIGGTVAMLTGCDAGEGGKTNADRRPPMKPTRVHDRARMLAAIARREALLFSADRQVKPLVSDCLRILELGSIFDEMPC